MSDILTPESEAELAETIREADNPFRIEGGGTRPVGVTDAETVLSTRALTGITLYEPGALTMVARAGTPLSEIEAALDAENQYLAFEPMDHRALLGTEGHSTIGGVMAANISGPRRVHAGAFRDFALGVRFVDGAGNIVKNGGRVMKNVTGYDLVKLMAGAHGTLGVLTEVAFKVLPKKDTTASILIYGMDDDTAIGAMTRALSSPFEVSGAAHWSRGVEGYPFTHLRVEGFADSVEYRCARLLDLLGDLGDGTNVSTDTEHVMARWHDTRDAVPFSDSGRDVWMLSVRPSDAVCLVHGLPPDIFIQDEPEAIFDWGGGRVWLQVEPNTDLRRLLGDFPGHATLVRAADETKRVFGVFHPEAPQLATLAKGLRARFDPRGLLNPGLMDAPAMEPA